MTRRAESPRPIPHTVRSPNISLRVANSDAVTVQSRVPGFVTMGPTFIRRVASRIREKMTKGSCHRMWESNVQVWVNPSVSARWARSMVRDAGGSVWRTMPNSMCLVRPNCRNGTCCGADSGGRRRCRFTPRRRAGSFARAAAAPRCFRAPGDPSRGERRPTASIRGSGRSPRWRRPRPAPRP